MAMMECDVNLILQGAAKIGRVLSRCITLQVELARRQRVQTWQTV
jgi:hypothetical protein